MLPHLGTLSLLLLCTAAAQAQDATLHDAARDGDNATLARLLSAGADANAEADGGWTPLMLATMGGNVDGARALLDAGADPNLGEADQGPPLCAAAMTPLAPVGDETAILRLLVERGARVDILNGAGMTPLMYAAREGNLARATFLIRKGADVNHRDARQWTPLRFAASSGNADVVRLLVAHGSDPNVLDESYRSPLHYAVLDGSVEIATVLLDAGADPNLSRPDAGSPTPLLMAAGRNDAAIVALLCARGASANYDDRGGLGDDSVARTALDWARHHRCRECERALASTGALTHAELERAQRALLELARSGDAKGVTKALAKHIDPRVPVRVDAETDVAPLDEAARHGSLAVVRAMLATHYAFDGAALASAYRVAVHAGHDDVAIAIAAHAPQLLAATAIGEHEGELARSMIERHPEIVAARDATGRTLLHLAAAAGETAVVSMLLERGADVGAKDSWQETPLFDAVRGGDVEIVDRLLAHRADHSARNLRGMTPLLAAARSGRSTVVSRLLSSGADPDAADHTGWCALHHAAWANSPATIDVLIAAGAKRDRLDHRRRAPLDLARQLNHADAATVLQQ